LADRWLMVYSGLRTSAVVEDRWPPRNRELPGFPDAPARLVLLQLMVWPAGQPRNVEEPMLSSARIEERLARRTIALVLAAGRGPRLHQLTAGRAKPAVFFGGKFRIIDFALSNCLNSNIRRIAVLTQYKAHSLLRHLQMGWSFLRPEMN